MCGLPVRSPVDRCYGEGVTLHPWRITRQKEWALTVLRNWFEKADVQGGA